MKDQSLLLFLTGGLAGVLTASAALHVVYSRRKATSLRHFDEQPPATVGTEPETSATVEDFLEDEILVEQFTRNVQFFGKQGQQKVAESFVVVIGLGVRAPKTVEIKSDC